MRKLLKVLIAAPILAAIAGAVAFYLLPAPACGARTYTDPSGFVVSADGQYAYLSDSIASRLLIVSLADNRLAAYLPLPAPTTAIAISRDGAKAYLLSGESDGAIFVVDTKSGRVERSIKAGQSLSGLALSVDGHRLFAVQTGAHKLLAFDAGSGTPSAGVPFECTSCTLLATPDGKALVAAHSRGLAVFNTENLQISSKIEIADRLGHVALSPDGKTIAYTTLRGSPGVHFFNLASGNGEMRATMGQVGYLAFSADGASVIASDVKLPQEQHGSLSIMPVHIPQEVKGAIVPSIPPDRSTTLAFDKNPRAIAVDGKGNHIDVLTAPVQGSVSIEVLDGTSHQVLARIPLPDARTSWDKFMAWRSGVLQAQRGAKCL